MLISNNTNKKPRDIISCRYRLNLMTIKYDANIHPNYWEVDVMIGVIPKYYDLKHIKMLSHSHSFNLKDSRLILSTLNSNYLAFKYKEKEVLKKSLNSILNGSSLELLLSLNLVGSKDLPPEISSFTLFLYYNKGRLVLYSYCISLDNSTYLLPLLSKTLIQLANDINKK